MNSYRGTKTEENLRAAFAGESMARNKYTYFSAAARKEGLDEIADRFDLLAGNEMMHAKFWFEALYGAPKSTEKNLVTAAQGEYDEWHSMYPRFADQARTDGFEQLADMFERVAKIERDHEKQFMSLLVKLLAARDKTPPPANVQSKKRLCDGHRCVFCGAVFDVRPDACDVCQAIGSFEACTYEVEST